jgi:hypothetical protein
MDEAERTWSEKSEIELVEAVAGSSDDGPDTPTDKGGWAPG